MFYDFKKVIKTISNYFKKIVNKFKDKRNNYQRCPMCHNTTYWYYGKDMMMACKKCGMVRISPDRRQNLINREILQKEKTK